jgi:tetratricopeptide (TPR) repeat protein
MMRWGALLGVAWIVGTPLLQAGPAEAESLYRRGLKLERAKSYAAAAAFYQAALDQDPSFAPALKEIGNCHFYLDEKDRAYNDYQNYLRLRPDDKVIAALAAKLVPPTPIPAPMEPRTRPVSSGKGVIEVRGLQKPAGEIAGWNLHMGEASGGAYKILNDKPIKSESYRIKNLVIGKKYYFSLTAVTADGAESTLSPGWSQVATADEE